MIEERDLVASTAVAALEEVRRWVACLTLAAESLGGQPPEDTERWGRCFFLNLVMVEVWTLVEREMAWADLPSRSIVVMRDWVAGDSSFMMG